MKNRLQAEVGEEGNSSVSAAPSLQNPLSSSPQQSSKHSKGRKRDRQAWRIPSKALWMLWINVKQQQLAEVLLGILAPLFSSPGTGSNPSSLLLPFFPLVIERLRLSQEEMKLHKLNLCFAGNSIHRCSVFWREEEKQRRGRGFLGGSRSFTPRGTSLGGGGESWRR